MVLRGHKEPIRQVAWCPNGARLASIGADGRTVIWDTSSGQRLVEFGAFRAKKIEPRVLDWDPNGRHIAVAETKKWNDSNVTIRDPQTGEIIRSLPVSGNVRHLSWSPCGRWILAVGSRIAVWDAESGQRLELRLEQLRSPWGDSERVVLGDVFAWSPNGSRLAMTISQESTPTDRIVVWEIPSGKGVALESGHEGQTTAVAFSPGRTKDCKRGNRSYGQVLGHRTKSRDDGTPQIR